VIVAREGHGPSLATGRGRRQGLGSLGAGCGPVTLRTVTMPIGFQQIITRDNVSIGVAAVACFRRFDPVKSIVRIEDVQSAINQIARTTVRSVVGRSPLDRVLSETETLNEVIKGLLDVTTERWGVLVQVVELKDIELPESMQRRVTPPPINGSAN
jgi:regulator of protease activity HflC (stomatin/prohibitin superfamily)